MTRPLPPSLSSSPSSGRHSVLVEADGMWIVKGQRPPILTHQPGNTHLGATCSSRLFDPHASLPHSHTHTQSKDHTAKNCKEKEGFYFHQTEKETILFMGQYQ